jgi:hypothetical protein
MKLAIAARSSIAIFSVVLSACTQIPAKVVLDAPKENKSLRPIDLRDARPIQSQIPATSNLGETASHQFGDEHFEPRVLTVLRIRLAEDLGEELQNKSVTVSEFVVRLTQVARPRYTGSTYVPQTPGMGVAGAILAGLLAGGMIGGIENARADRYVFCRIEATVDGKQVSGLGRQDSLGISEVETGAKTAVREAISALIQDIRVKLAAPPEDAPEATGAKPPG